MRQELKDLDRQTCVILNAQSFALPQYKASLVSTYLCSVLHSHKTVSLCLFMTVSVCLSAPVGLSVLGDTVSILVFNWHKRLSWTSGLTETTPAGVGKGMSELKIKTPASAQCGTRLWECKRPGNSQGKPGGGHFGATGRGRKFSLIWRMLTVAISAWWYCTHRIKR